MNRNTTLILVSVFAALVLYVLLVQKPADDAKANATPSPVASTGGTVFNAVTADKVLEVSVRDSASRAQVSFGRTASAAAWQMFAPVPGLADQVTAATNAATLAALTYQQVISPAQDLAAFGILSPTATIAVALADGSAVNLTIGDKSPTGAEYYVTSDKSLGVMVVSSASLDPILGWVTNPPVPPATPTQAFILETPTTPIGPAAPAATPTP